MGLTMIICVFSWAIEWLLAPIVAFSNVANRVAACTLLTRRQILKAAAHLQAALWSAADAEGEADDVTRTPSQPTVPFACMCARVRHST